MSRIYVSRSYIEKRQAEVSEIQRPTGSDLTASEKQMIQELLANKFRTRRLYMKHSERRQPTARILQ